MRSVTRTLHGGMSAVVIWLSLILPAVAESGPDSAASGDVASGDVASGDVASGDVASGDVASGHAEVEDGDQDLFVLRLAGTLIRPLVSADIQVRIPVDDVVLGVRARGESDTRGELWLELEPRRDRAAFVVHFRGTTVSRTKGNGGAAVLHSTATTRFHAAKKVHFDLDGGMRAGKVAVSARTATRLNGVRSRHAGVLGRIVRRVASRRFAQDLPTINRIARENAERRIADSFDRELDVRLTRVNEMLANYRPLLDYFRDSSPELVFNVNSSSTHLVFRICRREPGDEFAPTRPTSSLVEVWLHSSAIHRRQPAAMRQWAAFKQELVEWQASTGVGGVSLGEARVPVYLSTSGPWLIVEAGDEASFLARRRVGR